MLTIDAIIFLFIFKLKNINIPPYETLLKYYALSFEKLQKIITLHLKKLCKYDILFNIEIIISAYLYKSIWGNEI